MHITDDTLTLFHTHGIGPTLYQKLLKHFESDTAILSSTRKQREDLNLSQATIDSLDNPNQEAIERDKEWVKGTNNYIISQTSVHYPAMLKEIYDPPILLYLHGNPECLSNLQLSIVGSRNPTPDGRQCAFEFAHTLAKGGFTITSGLALGIDGAAHEGALAAGAPTIAVTGTGLDRVYPAAHRDLAHKIAEQGALISEFALGTSPLTHHFPRRNRIISALCTGCLVIEAALKSGSLITARHALEQGREVFAVPGSIHNALTKGCHLIIRDGAKLVENEQDIVDELGSLLTAQYEMSRPDTYHRDSSKAKEESQNHAHDLQQNNKKSHHSSCVNTLNKDTQELLNAISFDPVTADTLCSRSKFDINQVSSMLLILELEGFICAQTGGRYTKSP